MKHSNVNQRPRYYIAASNINFEVSLPKPPIQLVALLDFPAITWQQQLIHLLQYTAQIILTGSSLQLRTMDTPDISTIPVSIEQHAAELPKLTCKQLEQISNPQILDDDQQVFRAYIAS
jgi:hypothetical protein